MSLLCKVDGIPVFYSARDAMSFGMQYGLTNVHPHEHNGRIGYMPGSNHGHAVNVIVNRINQNAESEDALLNEWAGDVVAETSTTTYQESPEVDLLDQFDDDELPSLPPLNGGLSEGGGGGY